MVEANKTYVGIVEDNKDPDKLGRAKVRVMNIFDEIPLEDIPWASPWKDLNGNTFNTPEVGKVVMVVFDDGNDDNPEFIYSDHYNINLENKLKSLSDDDYTSMKSMIFDHKTQIYVNESEGLKIDHKYNNVNITDGGIDMNLKDNNSSLNLGDATAEQQAILGNHFIDWLDKFLQAIQAGGLFNGGGPAVPNPALLQLIVEFQSLKDLKFLSHHVNIADNNKITTVKGEDREDESQYGDKWTSTKEENNLTEDKGDSFEPKDGPKDEYNKPVGPSTQEQPVNSGFNEEIISEQEIENSIGVNQNTFTQEAPMDMNSKVEKLISFIESKNYKVYKQTNVLNIVALRDKDSGLITNKFDEILYVFYMNKSNNWELNEYKITTVPGYKRNTNDKELPENVSILAYGQYIDQCKLDYYQGDLTHRSLKFNECAIYVNDKLDRYNYSSELKKGDFGISIHRSTSSGTAESVYDYSSNGDQVFKNANQYKQFIKLCETQSSNKNTFTYTLCRKQEFDEFTLSTEPEFTPPTTPIDAVMGEWSEFGPCENGQQTRTREVLEPAQNGGTTGELEETQECTVGKYTYIIEDLGFEKQIVVFENNIEVFRGEPSLTAEDAVLVQEAKNNLDPFGENPDIQNMKRR